MINSFCGSPTEVTIKKVLCYGAAPFLTGLLSSYYNKNRGLNNKTTIAACVATEFFSVFVVNLVNSLPEGTMSFIPRMPPALLLEPATQLAVETVPFALGVYAGIKGF